MRKPLCNLGKVMTTILDVYRLSSKNLWIALARTIIIVVELSEDRRQRYELDWFDESFLASTCQICSVEPIYTSPTSFGRLRLLHCVFVAGRYVHCAHQCSFSFFRQSRRGRFAGHLSSGQIPAFSQSNNAAVAPTLWTPQSKNYVSVGVFHFKTSSAYENRLVYTQNVLQEYHQRHILPLIEQYLDYTPDDKIDVRVWSYEGDEIHQTIDCVVIFLTMNGIWSRRCLTRFSRF